MTTFRKILLTLAVIGAMSASLPGGTFANFSAVTTNPNNTFAAGSMTMTNVAGTAASGSNCSAATNSGTCATLFTASTSLQAGGSDLTNTVTIAYTGSVATGDFRLYGTSYSSKSGSSSPSCTATDPAAKINLRVKQGTTIIYPTSGTGYGTLAGFASTYTSTNNGLQLKGGNDGSGSAGVWSSGDQSTFTIAVNLDASADNTYQGCQSVVSLNWYASQ